MSDYLYEIALMGEPSDEVVAEISGLLQESLDPFGLTVGEDVKLSVRDCGFDPSQERGAAVAFFGSEGVSGAAIPPLLRRGVPVIPIASDFDQVALEIPECLQKLNCLSYQTNGALRVVTALLECIGLLPRQRRVFLSYRRNESREAALQLFDELSARNFEVFLDTHGIGPAVDFQATLWHQLCDCDVLVMLDTVNYFESRWTSAEFGRALAKGISVLRVGWPKVHASVRVATASQIELAENDFNAQSGQLKDITIHEISQQVEKLRSQSQAVRGLNLFSNVKQAINQVGGKVTGVGAHNVLTADIPPKGNVMIYPYVGVPTSSTLNEVYDLNPDSISAVVYDAVGLHSEWVNHLSWMNDRIRMPRYIKAHEAAWDLADLEG